MEKETRIQPNYNYIFGSNIFAVLGNYIFNHFSITFPALKIEGGIILFLVSLEMLFNKRRERKKKDANFDSDNISVFPLAIPLLADLL